MSRKHYEAIARALRATRPLWPYKDFGRFSDPEAQAKVEQWRADIAAVSAVLAADNPRFSHARFHRAVGLVD